MLPSSERLTRAGLFQRAYNARKSINTSLLTLYVLPRHDRQDRNDRNDRGRAPGKANNQTNKTSLASSPRLEELAKMQVPPAISANLLPLVGFVIAKKVCKSACARNRAKRRVREAYRTMRLTNTNFNETLAQWYALVFVLNNKILDADWAEVQKTVQDSLRKANDKYARSKEAKRESKQV
ncbi:MAG: ribonuclease P protein component [Candidatus Obscuribacterales bacterium]|nr:ribonuclease P protein component [Candidatus Obscuribacterales bacterium]